MRRRSKRVDAALAALRLRDGDPAAVSVIATEAARVRGAGALPTRQSDAMFAVLATIAIDGRRSVDTRREAIVGLRWFFDRRAARVLLEVIDRPAEHAELRAEAIEGLGVVLAGARRPRRDGDPLRARASAALGAGLTDPGAEIRFWSLYAVGVIGLSEHADRVRALTDDPAAAALGSVGREARDVLEVLVGGAWPTPRGAAASCVR